MALTSTEEALVRQLLDQQAAILSLAGNEATITSKLGATKVTLSDLLAASSVGDTDLFLTRQGTTDKSVTGAVLRNNLQTFLQGGTGAVVRGMNDKVREIISLKDFGAIGDGVTDDTTAWNNFKAFRSGRKLIPEGAYLVSGQVRTYENDVIEDDIQLFPPGYVGTENRAIENTFRQDRAALRVGASDTTSLNDERNFWRGLPGGGLANSWGTPALIGLFSTAFNRNGASYASYSNTFGHDCITYGVASSAGGAGSGTGDPDNPSSSNFEGYCAFAYGKNVLALGPKSTALCEEGVSKGRASFTAGYGCETGGWGSDDGLGSIALGNTSKSFGIGSATYGSYLVAYNGAVVFGSGINAGNPLTMTSKGVGVGANVVLPTIECTPGSGSPSSFGSVVIRGGLQTYGPEFVAGGVSKSIQSITNGGGGGYGEFQIQALVAGVMTPGWALDAGRLGGNPLAWYPMSDNASTLGSPSYRPSVVYAVSGTINTSDAREKQQIRELSAKEMAVAKRLKKLVKAFKWNSSVAEKGKDARIHVGFIAQEVKSAFEAEGLDAMKYGALCYDEWNAAEEVKDEHGNIVTPFRSAGDRYGVRHDQLLAFIIASL